MRDEQKTVWLLGAGFSRPLGGPLLPRLLSPSSFKNLESRFEKDHPVRSRAAKLVIRVFGYGTAYQFGKLDNYDNMNGGGERLWDDAEQFLDALDAASRGNGDGPSAKRILEIANSVADDHRPAPPIALLNAAAQRLVAAECSLFAIDADTTTERWDPYVRWAEQLRYTDTIVTFNYDVVPELLGLKPWLNGDSEFSEPFEEDDRPRVLKLHGSVNWRRETLGPNEYSFKVESDYAFSLTCEDRALAIATPGPTKAERCEQLRAIWRLAETELASADRIVFVGYRFPETDAQAKRRLLAAIGVKRTRNIYADIVLGPDTNHRDIARLRAMLGHAFNGNGVGTRITAEPLWAEDYFSVWRRG